MTAPDGFSAESLGDAGSSEPPRPRASFRVMEAGLDACPVGHVSCDPGFAQAVLTLAGRRHISVAQLADAVLTVMPQPTEADPGPGAAHLDAGATVERGEALLRRALATALALADVSYPLSGATRMHGRIQTLEYRNKLLHGALERVAFQPLDGDLTDVREAARLFGFVNEWCFDEDRVLRRFRELAPVYHPDTGVVACRQRMAQLIEARNLLVRHVRTAYAAARWRRAR